VCIPLTDQTSGLIDETALALLPDNAIVVNISRGAVIHEESLFRALESGRIRAGLDVWYTYPQDEVSRSHTFPSSLPFHGLPNVIMTPHIGGESDQTEQLWTADLQRMLALAASGHPLPNRVDLERGY
jgi:phosphoglycerate dehydrogenase-like enzyme